MNVPASEVLSRVRTVLSSRRAKGLEGLTPQALLPLDADEVEGLEFYPWRRALGSRRPVEIEDLLKAPSEAFVARCYRLVLLRDPSEEEAVQGAELLAKGWARPILVARIRFSPEGRRMGVPVSGIGLRLVPSLPLSVARRVGLVPRKAP